MTTQSRTVRVFLSSTFRDFAEERDLLVRTIFPELRRRCRERQVELVDVDLRWGITEEEAENGSVLSICLAEIDRARPYFMGFIGERYGWVPEKGQYDASIVQEQPWLEEHRGGKSVTELEMLHGVLNNPAMAGRAFFYFRDAKWSGKKGGAYLSEGTQEKTKLDELKARIRKSGFPVVENYPTPGKLAERVREDLWKLIDEAFPESEVPDALTMERRRHEAYTLSRIRLYLGGERYFTALDKAMDACKPVLITGQSGGGKSALIANWFLDWSSKHPKAAVVLHHLGCGADAADPVRMAVRLMHEIALVTGEEFKPESDPDKQLEQLPLWLAKASAWAQREDKEMLIVLDGLDKLSERKHLRWFPTFLPPQVKLVVSCLEGEILEATMTRLNWLELKVNPFTKAEQSRFTTEYLGRYRKKLTTPQVKTLQVHPLSCNPLFLLTVLEELRVFGVHEELEQRLATLLSLPSSKAQGDEPTVDDVFEHVLARVEVDLGKKPVQQAMEAIWASRAGLYYDELLAIAKLVPAQWAAIQNALDESIYESSGKISFGHDYLRKAVEDRYGLTGKKKLNLHRKLAGWFDDVACKAGVDERLAQELPWQFAKAGLKKELVDTLTDEAMFEVLYDCDKYQLIKYWLNLGKDPSRFYEIAWAKWKVDAEDAVELSRAGFRLAEFLREQGSTSPLLKEIYGQSEKAAHDLGKYKGEIRIGVENSKGLFFLNQGNFLEAEKIFRKGLEELESIVGRHHPDALDAINNLGKSLLSQGHHLQAELLYREALEARLKFFGENHPKSISSLIGCSLAVAALHKNSEAKHLMERALRISQNMLGDKAEQTLGIHLNLARLFRDIGSHKQSKHHYNIAEKGFIDIYGASHPLTLSCQSGYAGLLAHLGKRKCAKTNFEKVLLKRSELFGVAHPDTCSTHNDLAILSEQCKDLESAKSHYRLALKGRLKTLGPLHPDSIQSANNLANVLQKTGEFDAMEKVFSDYLKKLDRSFPKDHSLTLNLVNYLGVLKNKHGKRRQALALLRQRAFVSAVARDAVCYNLACYECLEGNIRKSTRLICEYLGAHPEFKDQALSDEDLHAIHEEIIKL
jgi:nephrocystin-3